MAFLFWYALPRGTTEGNPILTLDDFLAAELPGLSRFAGALTGDPYLAEDVLSDALLALVPRWRKVSTLERPAAYVRQIVVNTYLSERRKTARRRTAPTADTCVLDRAGPDASEAVVRQDEVDRLLSQLTSRQRAAVVMRYLLDQDDQQIAEALGCTPATVRSHLSQARAVLRLPAQPTTQEG
ncbi:SigE family RNA polymerase sigma factor [Streptomyces tateyamensis]|uniref:SigE family RNA polymerase sigma factor n=1 Tax=Streptomyces tateyamensis TaxID=565073 RepID=A0A2V4PB34_9ACTN|nr:sigma-70 family RNA polymerase sigma factor [Streptomyces tateyamensis]PYC88421.1 SigE family RNA polymerase sigma factor [Streptomyces tateyamensis]